MSAATGRSQRTCLGCGEVLEKNYLLRYVVSPQGQVLVDYQGKLPGRGAYTCYSASCLRQALKRGRFRRAFRTDLESCDADELTADLRRQIIGRAGGLIGMARKSGALVVGSNQVLDGLSGREPLTLVLRTADMSAGIAGKIEGAARKAGAKLFTMFEKDKLGNMLGRDEVSVVGLRKSTLADSLELELQRYQRITEGL